MGYLDYETYQEYGGTLDETVFNDLEFQAEALIDWYTFSRLQNETELPERVNRCMYAIIKLLHTKMIASAIPLQDGTTTSFGQAGIVQQSNDGVSITYNTLSADEITKSCKDEIKSCIQMYLQNVKNSLGQKVLYRGIYPNE